MSERPRILVLQSSGQNPANSVEFPDCDVVRAGSVAEGIALLENQSFDCIFASAREPQLWQRAGSLLQNDFVLEVLGEGVAAVQPDLRVLWANTTFEKWCGGEVRGKSFYDALNHPEILGPDYCPFHTALVGKVATTRLHCHDNQYLELKVTPVANSAGKVHQLISLCRNITPEVQQQQKLDALHQAGRELAGLEFDSLAEMDVDERIEMLKQNIRRLTKDLLHYDVIEIRLLNPDTLELVPLLTEGMTKDAAGRALYARTDDNGVTGFVAATGKSYLCTDTAVDPLYIEGAEGARSSLTVALTHGDKVIGTFNVESPQPGSFTEMDVQFTEIFCREVATALHTLELLSAEKRSTATQSIEAVSREVALPVDDILNTATGILERWIGHEPEMAERLKHIISSARSIKQSIQKVGENLAPQAMALTPSCPEPTSKIKGMRVLVIDNDERVRRSAHSILGRFGCIVETARDGREASTMARLSAYDAIIADIRLPDLSGYDVFKAIRQARPEASVILMTGFGYDPSHSIVKARQEGLRSVLYKPFRVDQLVDALSNCQTPTLDPPLQQDPMPNSNSVSRQP